MKITYDMKYEVAYIRLDTRGHGIPTKGPKSTPVHISDDVIVDVASDGTVRGIELLNARAQLGTNIRLSDDQTGEVRVIELTAPEPRPKRVAATRKTAAPIVLVADAPARKRVRPSAKRPADVAPNLAPAKKPSTRRTQANAR